MTASKPKADLELYFPGEGVYPEKIPVRWVADALSAIHRLATPDIGAGPEDEGAMPPPIRLLSVLRGSAVFRCVAEHADSLVAQLRTTSRTLSDPERVANLGNVLPPLRRLSEIAAALKSPIIVRAPEHTRRVYAKFDAETYPRLSDTLLVRIKRSVSGNVQRVGGATSVRCVLRVPDSARLLYCDVANSEVARTLGPLLYQDVRVTGTATCLRTSWQIIELRIEEVVLPSRGSWTEALGALREAAGDGWDRIDDPERYLEEVSGSR
jgi:hypothetical protein